MAPSLLKMLVLLAVGQMSLHCSAELSDEDAKLRDENISKLDTPPEKMKVRELQQLLRVRGESCKACSDKADLVARVWDVMHLPEIPALEVESNKQGAKPEEAGSWGSADEVPDLESILEKLKGIPGMDNAQVFDKDALSGLKDRLERRKRDGTLKDLEDL